MYAFLKKLMEDMKRDGRIRLYWDFPGLDNYEEVKITFIGSDFVELIRCDNNGKTEDGDEEKHYFSFTGIHFVVHGPKKEKKK